jgi:hypothetical protein
MSRTNAYSDDLRKKIVEARTREVRVEVMGGALDAITARDARGFFEHRGYRTMGQPL